MPRPVIRIAPKPRRRTGMSPPTEKVVPVFVVALRRRTPRGGRGRRRCRGIAGTGQISDVPVAVARSAVVVGVVVTAVALRNGVWWRLRLRRRWRRRRWRWRWRWGRRRRRSNRLARGRDREPGAAERRQVLAVGLSRPCVLDEGVERVAVVGRLSLAVGPRDGSDQRGGCAARTAGALLERSGGQAAAHAAVHELVVRESLENR